MPERSRGGRPWGSVQAQTPEAEALALFLRAQIDACPLTMTVVAKRISYSSTQTSQYLSGLRVPEQKFVAALISVTVPAPQLRRHRLAEAEKLLYAATHPASSYGAGRGPGQDPAAELEQVRMRQVETYERLTRALEQQAELHEAAKNSAQLVMVLLTMIKTLEGRVMGLSAERDQLLNRTDHRQALEDTRQQLVRAQDQERQAKEELERAREKQRQAEDLAVRVQQQVLELNEELNRLRTGTTDLLDGRPEPGEGADTDPGSSDVVDPVGDDIAQALAHAVAVNDADDQTLQRISEELQAEPSHQTPPDRRSAFLGSFEVVLDNTDNPSTSTDPVFLREEALRLTAAGDYAKASQLFADLVGDCTRRVGADDESTLNARREHARCVGEAGEHDQAVVLLADIVGDCTRLFGVDHRATYQARHQHAHWVGQTGESTEAARLYADLTRDSTRAFGADHQDTLLARYQHAHHAGERGERTEAVKLYADLVRDYVRVFGAHHPDTLLARLQYAHGLGEMGERTEAVRLYPDIVEDSIHLLGADHQITLIARHQHAHHVGEMGDRTEAVKLYAHLIRDRLRVSGPDHTDTLQARYRHAHNLAIAGNRSEAVHLLISVIFDRVQIFGPRHRGTIQARETLSELTS
ncbi:tetratricopeptide repeat protein [Kitasatospora sp. P5_F3]